MKSYHGMDLMGEEFFCRKQTSVFRLLGKGSKASDFCDLEGSSEGDWTFAILYM